MDRLTQVNELRAIADIISYYDTTNCTAHEAVEYYESVETMPEWYDEHDRRLLIKFAGEAIS